MENAADALKIAFGIFVFVVGITITFSLISQAKSAADYVLYYSDETNFYEHLNSKENNRIVSVSQIIPKLYRYYDGESIGITIKLNDGKTYIFDLGNIETNLLNENSKFSSPAEREENLAKFIDECLLEYGANSEFIEEFVEVPITGIFERGEDDTEIILSAGGKKVYITYIQQ